MAIISFVRTGKDPLYEIKKFSQAIWIDEKGHGTFDLECIVDLTDIEPSHKLFRIRIFLQGEIDERSLEDRTSLFQDEDFCSYLYDGLYSSRDPDHVEVVVSPTEQEYVKLAEIDQFHVRKYEGCTLVSIEFKEPMGFEHSHHDIDVCYGAFRIRYRVLGFSKKIKGPFYSEPTWALDIRHNDMKMLGDIIHDLQTIVVSLCYFWVVLPQGRFVIAHAPTDNCRIRILEMWPWKNIYPYLRGNSICYGWSFQQSSKGKTSIHMEFRTPALNTKISFFAFVIGAMVFFSRFIPEVLLSAMTAIRRLF